MAKVPDTTSRSMVQILQHFIRTRFWKMDIDHTARIAPSAYVDRTNPRGIHIAAHCIIDHEAIILSHDMTRGIRPHTHIGTCTIIGARAIVMPGVSIGQGCRVMPGAVVLKNVPDGVTVGGNPATAATD